MSNILDRSAREIRTAYEARTLSPVDYMAALIERVRASEPAIHALWDFAPERAMAEARAAERRYAAGTPLGRLDGLPVTLKELIATQGDPVPNGTAATDLVPASQDAPIAARMREEGAIVFAKTTCPDYGMLSSGLSTFHDLSRNPWVLSENPGGSSAGAGSAGAAGYGPLHVGTDIGGSVRLPAGWTGLFGFKPTFGRIPMDPYYTGRCAGPMTPTVDDAAFLMPALARADARDATSLPFEELDWDQGAADLRGMRLGLMMDAGCGLAPDADVAGAVRSAADLLADTGAEIVPVGPVLTREMLDGLDVAWRARFWGMMEALDDAARARVLPYILTWAQGATAAGPVDVARGYDQTFAMRRSTAAAFAEIDAILSPVNPTVSYPADWESPTNDPARPFEHICFTMPWNMGEQPACSINCGFAASGMPIGLQIVAPRFHDLRVFGLARAYEMLRGPITTWPRYDRVAEGT